MINPDEKFAIMTQAAKQLREMIQNRLSSRIEILQTLASSPVDNLPDSVKEKREEEAGKIRAVMQEQKDIIAIIQMLFPDA